MNKINVKYCRPCSFLSLETEGFKKNFLEWSAQMRRRSATTGLIMKASCVLQETVGVFSEPERGAAILAVGAASRRVASCKMRAASSRSELVILPWGLVEDTRLS